MKVELELDATQLNLLDNNLKECLLSLNKEQQVQLLQNYINNQLEGFRKEKERDGYWHSLEYEYTDFGKQMIDGLRDKIEETISTNILNRPEINSLIGEKIQEVSGRIDSIIENALAKYIIEHLFIGKDAIENEIRNTIYQMRQQNNNHY